MSSNREVDGRDPEQQRGRGARLAGRGNRCELLINTVMIEVPKLLTGTNQKVRGRLLRLDFGVRRSQNHR